MSIFEIIMLICFGLSWPVSISKSYRTKNVEGKSVIFLYIIITGYLFGVVHKIKYNYDWVTYLYAYNACLVFIDSVLWHKYNISKKIKESYQLIILKELARYFDYYTQLYDIKVRRIGQKIFIEIFLEFEFTKQMSEIHSIIENLKTSIEAGIKFSNVLIIPARTKPK